MPEVKVTRREPRYDVASLRDAIRRAEADIVTYEAAIAERRTLITEYRQLIERELERRASASVPVEVIATDDDVLM